MQNIIEEKKIIFYHDILQTSYADIEDLFSLEDYLAIYNGAFSETVKLSDIDSTKPIVNQLNKLRGNNFNHYAPANYLAKNINNINLSEKTYSNFERLFDKINRLFNI